MGWDLPHVRKLLPSASKGCRKLHLPKTSTRVGKSKSVICRVSVWFQVWVSGCIIGWFSDILSNPSRTKQVLRPSWWCSRPVEWFSMAGGNEIAIAWQNIQLVMCRVKITTWAGLSSLWTTFGYILVRAATCPSTQELQSTARIPHPDGARYPPLVCGLWAMLGMMPWFAGDRSRNPGAGYLMLILHDAENPPFYLL